jgi:hypothetical protein
MSIRTYTRINSEHEETVFVHVDDNGYVRMTAANLHDILTHIGFQPTKEIA